MFNPAEVHSVVLNGATSIREMFNQLNTMVNMVALTIGHSVQRSAVICGENRRTFLNDLQREASLKKPLISFDNLAIKETLLNVKQPKRYMKKLLEAMVIEEALILSYGNKTKAAELIGINRHTLNRRLRGFNNG